jgi:hypothetical protein
LVVAIASGIAGTANAKMALGRDCGTLTGGGSAWHVVAAAVPCGDAKGLVRKLIPKMPASGVVALGTYSTLHCTGAVTAGKRGIMCASVSGKLVEAFAK